LRVEAIDHVQLAMPAGGEARAREFYEGLLGIAEVPKPAALAGRGGCWFERGALRLHLGLDAEFRPARKAHPGLLVSDLPALVARLQAAGRPCAEEAREGRAHVYVDDPFGNRIELIATAPATR
jgi:catechol 2,3-dioxygenase-like lactoylglutathione lyase family enzyme